MLARDGDVIVTIGAGDVDRAAPVILGELERMSASPEHSTFFLPPGRYRALPPH